MLDLVQFLWWCLTAPVRLFTVLWPALILLPLFASGLASVMRAFVLGRVDRMTVHPAMRSGPRWALAVGLGTFALVWLFVTAGVAVALLVSGASR